MSKILKMYVKVKFMEQISLIPPEYLIWKLSQLAFNITWLKNHFWEQNFSENVSKLLPCDFSMWNTREKKDSTWLKLQNLKDVSVVKK